MNLSHFISLDLSLRAAALTQLAVAILNLFLVRIMKWKPDLDRAPLLVREVFRIHIVFISITLSIFAVLTWRFAHEIASALQASLSPTERAQMEKKPTQNAAAYLLYIRAHDFFNSLFQIG